MNIEYPEDINRKRKESHFETTSVAFGLTNGCLRHLAEGDKIKIITLLAQVSEKSYRRGYQQGQLNVKGLSEDDVAVWRFSCPSDQSDMRDIVQSAQQRLWLEYPVLRDLGFNEN